jgi:hypothetical protein
MVPRELAATLREAAVMVPVGVGWLFPVEVEVEDEEEDEDPHPGIRARSPAARPV